MPPGLTACETAKAPMKSRLDPEAREALLGHVTEFVGPVAGVLRVPASDGSIDLLHVPPTTHKPYHVFVTSGLSATPMAVPKNDPTPRWAELLLSLPTDWPLDPDALAERPHRWPLELLARLAAFPQATGGWLGAGHTFPNSDPPQPYVPGLDFCAALIAPPLTVFSEVRRLTRPSGETMALWGVVPIFERELELKLEQGVDALFARFDAAGVNELLDVRRASVAGLLVELLKEER